MDDNQPKDPHLPLAGSSIHRAGDTEFFEAQAEATPEPGRRARKAAFYKHRPVWSTEGDFSCEHGQVFLYDRYRRQGRYAFEASSARAEIEGIGFERRMICLRLPLIASDAGGRLRISFYDQPPVIRETDWEGIFLFGLRIPSKQLVVAAGQNRIFSLHERGRFAARWQYEGCYHQLQLWRRRHLRDLRPGSYHPRQIR